jgi:hypothetical protein
LQFETLKAAKSFGRNPGESTMTTALEILKRKRECSGYALRGHSPEQVAAILHYIQTGEKLGDFPYGNGVVRSVVVRMELQPAPVPVPKEPLGEPVSKANLINDLSALLAELPAAYPTEGPVQLPLRPEKLTSMSSAYDDAEGAVKWFWAHLPGHQRRWLADWFRHATEVAKELGAKDSMLEYQRRIAAEERAWREAKVEHKVVAMNGTARAAKPAVDLGELF